jgi:hypothetical protein
LISIKWHHKEISLKASTLLSRVVWGPAKVLRVDSSDRLLQALAEARRRRLLRLEVPMAQAATEGAFAFAGGWHPFVAAIHGGPDVLARFYERLQPTSLGAFYALDSEGLGQLGPRHLPWLPPPRDYRGEKGLGPEHGVSLFGPCSRAKIELEHARLTQTVASIAARGYLPDQFGDITGYFLLADGEFRFLVRGGKHRAAALAAMGWTHLPVRFKPGWVRAVGLDSLAEWPMVRAGHIVPSPARQVFERYFEWNGSERRPICDPP